MHLSQFAIKLNEMGCDSRVGTFALRVVSVAPSPANAISGESATTATVPAGAKHAVVQNTSAANVTYALAAFPALVLAPGERLALATDELKLLAFSSPVVIWYY